MMFCCFNGAKGKVALKERHRGGEGNLSSLESNEEAQNKIKV